MESLHLVNHQPQRKEQNLVATQQQSYGTITPPQPPIEETESCFSESSSEELAPSSNVINRKKKRLQRHHRSTRPKLVSRLSHMVRSAQQSEEENDADDVIDMTPNDLIIPELDPK